MPIFQHNLFLHRKWENGRKSDLRRIHYAAADHTALMQFRKCDFAATRNLVSNTFRKDDYQPVPLKSTVLAGSWAASGPEFSGYSQFLTVGEGQTLCWHTMVLLATHTENHQHSTEVSHHCVHFCRILSISVRLVLLRTINIQQ